MAFADRVSALLDTYSKCLSLLQGQAQPDATTAGASPAELSRTIRSDRDQVHQVYSDRLRQNGARLQKGDGPASSVLRRILRRLKDMIASLVGSGDRKPRQTTTLAQLNYDALRALSNESRIEAVQAIDALSERLSSCDSRYSGSGRRPASSRTSSSGRSTSALLSKQPRHQIPHRKHHQLQSASHASPRGGQAGKMGHTGRATKNTTLRRDADPSANDAIQRSMKHRAHPLSGTSTSLSSSSGRGGGRGSGPRDIQRQNRHHSHGQDQNQDGHQGQDHSQRQTQHSAAGHSTKTTARLRGQHHQQHQQHWQNRQRDPSHRISFVSSSSGSTKIGEIPESKWPQSRNDSPSVAWSDDSWGSSQPYNVRPVYPLRPFAPAKEQSKRGFFDLFRRS